jgi:hypothetical protein
MFVPLSFNYLRASGYKTDVEFINKVGGPVMVAGDGTFCCTADGKVLSVSEQNLSKPWAAWLKLPESQRKPGAIVIEDRGVFDPISVPKGTQVPPEFPSGGLALVLYCRQLTQDEKGQWSVVQWADWPQSTAIASGDARVNRDFVWLKPEEVKALVPAQVKKGDIIPLPASLRNRLSCAHLVDHTLGLADWWNKAFLRSAEINLVVEDVSPVGVTMRLEGSVLLAHDLAAFKSGHVTRPGQASFDGRLLGSVHYDARKQVFDQFDFVAVGELKDHTAAGDQFSEGKQPGPWKHTLGIAFRLARDCPAERLPPFRSYFAGVAKDFYWTKWQ